MFLYIFRPRSDDKTDINKLSIINLNWELIFHFHFFFHLKNPKKSGLFIMKLTSERQSRYQHELKHDLRGGCTWKSFFFVDDKLEPFFSLEQLKFTSHEIKKIFFIHL